MHANLFMIHLSVYRTVGDSGARVGLKGKMDQKFKHMISLSKNSVQKHVDQKYTRKISPTNTSVDQKRPLPVFQVYVVFDKICDQ